MNTLTPLSYLHILVENSLNLWFLSHSNLDAIIQPLNESPHFLCLGGDQEINMTRQFYESYIILNHNHMILLKMLILASQLISPSAWDVPLKKQLWELSPRKRRWSCCPIQFVGLKPNPGSPSQLRWSEVHPIRVNQTQERNILWHLPRKSCPSCEVSPSKCGGCNL